jgi:osmotically-inducible protein OsmY
VDFLLLLRRADEMGINFWLRLLALGLSVSLLLLMSYYFLVVNEKNAPPPASAVATDPSLEKRQSDAALAARLRSTLARTKRLYNFNIGIESNDGKITLTGEVPTEIDKELAGELAQETSGVKEVRNQLQVTPSLARASEDAAQINATVNVEDLEMEANLRESLQAIAELKPQAIVVKVKHRAVTLTGRVATEQQRTRVEQIIRNAPKVTSVTNQLRVGN